MQPEYIDITEDLLGYLNLIARYFSVRKVIAAPFMESFFQFA